VVIGVALFRIQNTLFACTHISRPYNDVPVYGRAVLVGSSRTSSRTSMKSSNEDLKTLTSQVVSNMSLAYCASFRSLGQSGNPTFLQARVHTDNADLDISTFLISLLLRERLRTSSGLSSPKIW